MNKKQIKEILAGITDEKEREETRKLLESQADGGAVSDEAFMKGVEVLANAVAGDTGKDGKDGKEAKDFRRNLHTASEETDEKALEDMIAQKQAPKEERLQRYLKAKQDNDAAYVRQTHQRVARYFKALFDDDRQVVRALTEGTDANGGYLVPEEFRAEVVQEMQNSAVMRRIATVFPMGTDTLDIPTEAARPAVRWTAEDATIATSSAEFGQVTLTPKKLIGRLPVTRELANDAAVQVVSYLARVFGQEIGEKEDDAFFTGTGSGQPRGIDAETLTTVSAGSNKGDSIINLFYTLKKAYRSRSNWVMNGRTIRNIRKLKDADNQYLWQPSLQAGEPDLLLGRPVEEQNDIADGKIFFGDFSYYFIGDREQISAETTTEGGTAWERDRIELKVRERVDGRAALVRAFVEGSGF